MLEKNFLCLGRARSRRLLDSAETGLMQDAKSDDGS